MSLLDTLVLVIVVVSVVAGFVAGFARVGVGFAGMVAGILLGFWFYGIPAEWVHTFVKSVAASNLIGFFLVFWACLFAGALLGKLLSKVFKWTGLSWIDKTLGGVFGLVRGAIISTAFIAVVMAFTPKPAPNWMVDSRVLPYAMGATGMVAALAPNGIKEAFRTTAAEIRQVWNAQLKKTRDQLTGTANPGGANQNEKQQAEPPKEEPKKEDRRTPTGQKPAKKTPKKASAK